MTCTSRIQVAAALLLAAVTLAHAAPAPAPAPSDMREQVLNSINTQRNSSGPALLKTADAAFYLTAAMYNVSSSPLLGAASHQTLIFNDGGRVTLTWAGNTQTIVLAFVEFQNSTASQLNATSDPLMSDAINQVVSGRTITADDFDPLTPLLADPNDENLYDAINEAAMGEMPLRFVITGYGPSGGIARLAAVWAAFNYPRAHIRLVTFGAPNTGGQKFDWAMSFFVDLVYLWTVPGDNRTAVGASAPYAAVVGTLSPPQNAAPVTSANVTWDYYLAALNNTMFNTSNAVFAANDATSRASSSQSLGDKIKGFFTSAGDALDAVSAYFDRAKSPEVNNQTEVNAHFLTAENNGSCPVWLCKARLAVAAACDVYNNANSSIAPGSISIYEPNTQTNLAVAWFGNISTALIAFQGSVTTQDWLTDFKGWLSQDSLAPILENYFPQASVHQGFLGALQSVTSMAKQPQYNITYVLNSLTGGVQPAHIYVTGHSLGGGLATLASVWASTQWPEADITTVTIGSPLTGNAEWARGYRTFNGRQLRHVFQKDVVPSLPPLNSYVAIGNGTWNPDGSQWVLEDRTGVDFSNLNWDDHACENYKNTVFRVQNVSAPSWVTTATM